MRMSTGQVASGIRLTASPISASPVMYAANKGKWTEMTKHHIAARMAAAAAYTTTSAVTSIEAVSMHPARRMRVTKVAHMPMRRAMAEHKLTKGQGTCSSTLVSKSATEARAARSRAAPTRRSRCSRAQRSPPGRVDTTVGPSGEGPADEMRASGAGGK